MPMFVPVINQIDARGEPAISDFNNDSIPDIAVGSSGQLSIMFGNGDGTFRLSQSFQNSLYNYPLSAVADVNDDGNRDIVFVTQPLNNIIKLFVASGNRDGTFNEPTLSKEIQQITNGVFKLYVVDINNDEDFDVIVCGRDDGLLTFIGDGDGTFTEYDRYENPIGDGGQIGDVNNDQYMDIVTAHLYANNFYIYFGNETGNFTGPSQASGGASPNFSALADLNKDGNLDIIAPNAYFHNTVTISFGDGNGVFGNNIVLSVPEDSQMVSVGDYDNDGNLDVASLSNEYGTTNCHLMIFLGHGDGTFSNGVDNTFSGINIGQLKTTDFNKDGLLDLSISTDVFAVLLNQSETAQSSVTLSGPATLTEGRTGTYTVTLSAAQTSAVTVSYATASGTATIGRDVGSINTLLTIAAGQTSATFTVPTVDDSTHESNETFTVSLSNPSGATLGTTRSVTTTITDNDAAPLPTLTLSGPASIAEGNSGSSNATYTVTLSAAQTSAVTVSYATANGSATAGSDFGSINTLLTIAAGRTSATFTVPIVGDTTREADETFTVALSTPSGATLGTTRSVTTTITNDDSAIPTLTLSGPSSVQEGNTDSNNTATYTVTLSSSATTAVTVVCLTSGNTATAGIDFSNVGNVITIAAGRTSGTFTVPILGDTAAEAHETFSVAISNPTGATLGGTTSVTTTIRDDDGTTTTPDDTTSGTTDAVQSATTRTLGNDEQNLTLTGTSAIDGIGNSLDNIITGNSAANTLQGESGNDQLFGKGGDDILYGGSGNDDLDGGSGSDRMIGGTGNDTYHVAQSGDRVSEEVDSGTDLVASSVTWSLGNNLENLTLTGTSAINGTGNSQENILTGNDSDNTLTSGDGNDTLSGNAGDDTLFGEAGDDLLDGGTGADRMIGGSGNDTYRVGNASDITTESTNAGTDWVQASLSWTLAENIENLTLTGTNSTNGTGNSAANTLRGNRSANTLRGQGGADQLFGMAGEDALYGGDGTDRLIGGSGQDTLSGGAGADQFKWSQPSDGGDDITDFSASQGDQLLFVSSNFGNLSVGKLGSSRLALSSTGRASNTSQRFIFNTSTGVLKYDVDGSGSVAATTIATLGGVSTLSVNQIQIVTS
ncbi:MAG: VCBS repeat-containing protein [Magnetococcales bacterium]|nr:VCBS repeat-containing protein [Magnetococcales bacterium]